MAGEYMIYERRGPGCRWNLAGSETTEEKARGGAERLLSAGGYPEQETRIKFREKWLHGTHRKRGDEE